MSKCFKSVRVVWLSEAGGNGMLIRSKSHRNVIDVEKCRMQFLERYGHAMIILVLNLPISSPRLTPAWKQSFCIYFPWSLCSRDGVATMLFSTSTSKSMDVRSLPRTSTTRSLQSVCQFLWVPHTLAFECTSGQLTLRSISSTVWIKKGYWYTCWSKW